MYMHYVHTYYFSPKDNCQLCQNLADAHVAQSFLSRLHDCTVHSNVLLKSAPPPNSTKKSKQPYHVFSSATVVRSSI